MSALMRSAVRMSIRIETLAIAVPAVEGVKDPEAVNFQFAFANGKLYVSNYDGTVLAFGPAGSDAASEEAPAEQPATDAG